MEQWQDATSRQVKVLTGRLNELLSSGLELLHTELGVDLGLRLEPGGELIPPWVVMLAGCVGLVLMVALWASTCRRIICRKRPAGHGSVEQDDCVEIKAAAVKQHVVKTSEEVKKKKKKAEKKAQVAQPNGRVLAEPQEEAMVAEESLPHHHQAPPPEVKAEPVPEVKKFKKKAKQTAKETKTTGDGKEPEGGTWETKVSNKEKREQRKKDKPASPKAGDTSNSAPPEQLKTTAASVPSSQKKKKGDSSKVKAENVEAVVSQVNSSEAAMPAAVVAGVLTDNPVEVSSHTAGQDDSQSSASQEKNTPFEIDGSWTVIESGIKTSDLKAVSLTEREVVAEPQASERPWSNQPRVEDEWSGLNGGSVDPSSDWNAPSEAWGNFEEPTPEPPVIPEDPSPEPAKDEEEEEKMETAADGAAKTKKKKKKKKRAAENGDVAAQEVEEAEKEVVSEAPVKKQQPIEEAAPVVQTVKAAAVEVRVERPVKENASQKPHVTPVPQKEPTAKQNDIAAPTQQKKLEESQAPKPAPKKKKARRET